MELLEICNQCDHYEQHADESEEFCELIAEWCKQQQRRRHAGRCCGGLAEANAKDVFGKGLTGKMGHPVPDQCRWYVTDAAGEPPAP